MPLTNYFDTASLKSEVNGNFVWLPVEKQVQFINLALKIADMAVEKNFGGLKVSDVEVYQSLKDENEARLIDFLGGNND